MKDEMTQRAAGRRASADAAAAWRLLLSLAGIMLVVLALAAGCVLGVRELCAQAARTAGAQATATSACRAARVVDALLANIPFLPANLP